MSCVWGALKLCMFFGKGGAGTGLIRYAAAPRLVPGGERCSRHPPPRRHSCAAVALGLPPLSQPLPHCLPNLVHNSAHILQVHQDNAR